MSRGKNIRNVTSPNKREFDFQRAQKLDTCPMDSLNNILDEQVSTYMEDNNTSINTDLSKL